MRRAWRAMFPTRGRLIATILAVTMLAVACDDGSGDEAGAEGSDAAADAPVLYEGDASDVYADEANWICRPDRDDWCAGGLDTTVIDADGIVEVAEWTPAEDPPIDCFYVYPTTSQDPGLNSDFEWAEDEEGFATINQAARLGEVCRVFAPVYRSVTSTALSQLLGGGDPTASADASETAYADVADAFKHYMANDNDGRGFVLVGHSQGSGMLGRLIAEEIDPDDQAAVRERFVSAFLAGWPPPALTESSGDFANIPLCESAEQIGCIVTWASFQGAEPPIESTPFARAASGAVAGGCVNPAAPGGGSAPLDTYLPIDAAVLFGDAGADVTTPFIEAVGMIHGECVSAEGSNYLAVDLGDLAPLAAAVTSTPGWGLHTVDVSLVMGDILAMIADETETYAATG